MCKIVDELCIVDIIIVLVFCYQSTNLCGASEKPDQLTNVQLVFVIYYIVMKLRDTQEVNALEYGGYSCDMYTLSSDLCKHMLRLA